MSAGSFLQKVDTVYEILRDNFPHYYSSVGVIPFDCKGDDSPCNCYLNKDRLHQCILMKLSSDIVSKLQGVNIKFEGSEK